MEKLEFAKALGEKIIKSQHEYFVTTKSEDLKSEIVSEDKTDDLVEHLRRFSKNLYMSNCIKNKNEEKKN